MKKMFIFFAVLCLAIGMVGCSGNTPSIAASGNSETQESSNSLVSTSDPSNAPSDPSTAASEPSIDPTTDGDDLPAVDKGCAIVHRFGSIKDLNTYFTTGSTDLADYQFEPGTLLADMPNPNEIIRRCGYRSIYEYFAFDEAVFDYVEACFTFTDSWNVIYKYFLDNILITIEPTDSTDLLACYKSMYDIVSDDEIIPYAKDVGSTAKHMFREDPACNVIYYLVDGVKKSVDMILGDSYITITLYCDDDSLADAFDEFMANPKAAAFSAFFSDTDSVFHDAVAKATNTQEKVDTAESTASSTQNVDPSYIHSVDFDSIDELKNAASVENRESILSEFTANGVSAEQLAKVEILLNKIRSQGKVFPCLNGEAVTFPNKEGYANISLFPSELYRLPWIFFHPTVSSGKNYYIKVACLPDSITENRDGLTASAVIKELSPNSPNVGNLGERHKAIYEQTIRLLDREVTALVCEFKDDDRNRVTFVYDDLLIEVNGDPTVWSWQWFATLSFEYPTE